MKTTIFIAVLLVFSSCAIGNKLSEQKPKVASKINDKNYSMQFQRALPSRMQPRHLTSEYSLTIANDSANAYLPYFGYASSAHFSHSEAGIKFHEKMTNYVQKRNKRNDGWDIDFEVKSNTVSYVLRLTVFDNASTSLNVISFQRDPITFFGEMKLDD